MSRIFCLAALLIGAGVLGHAQTPAPRSPFLVSASELEALAGSDADAAFVVSDALSRFFATDGTRTVTVAVSQVREHWLPRMPAVRFVRLTDDAMQAHLASCMLRTQVAMTLRDFVLTVTVGDGTMCRSGGTGYDYVRVSGAWQRDVSGRISGFASATGHCRCPNGL